jgi:hypothetical protein
LERAGQVLGIAGVGGHLQRAQKQQRLGDQPLLAGGIGAPPGVVERAHLADRHPRRRQRGTKLLALAAVGARQRHQVLHRRVRRHRPGAHSLLRRGHQLVDQREPSRHPALGTAEPARQIIEREAVAGAQPAE